MVTVADVAGGSAGAAAVLALVLAVLALRAYRVTRSLRHVLLAVAFTVSAGQAGVTAWLLQEQVALPPAWLLVPIAHAATMLAMYVALLRV